MQQSSTDGKLVCLAACSDAILRRNNCGCNCGRITVATIAQDQALPQPLAEERARPRVRRSCRATCNPQHRCNMHHAACNRRASMQHGCCAAQAARPAAAAHAGARAVHRPVLRCALGRCNERRCTPRNTHAPDTWHAPWSETRGSERARGEPGGRALRIRLPPACALSRCVLARAVVPMARRPQGSASSRTRRRRRSGAGGRKRSRS